MSPEKEKIKGELRELIGERFKTYNKSAEHQIAETEETIATAQERLTGGGERSQPGMPVVTSRLNTELLQLVVPKTHPARLRAGSQRLSGWCRG